MNLVELLILLAFIFFPLIQMLLEKLGGNKGRGDQLPPEFEQEAYTEPFETERQSGVAVDEAPVENEWAAGWGSWPSTNLPEEPVVAAPRREEAAEVFIRSREQAQAEVLPEAVRMRTPVVSLEPLKVDRAEATARRYPRSKGPPLGPQRRKAVLESAFRERGSIRQAVVLAEVLGPPRALKPLDQEWKD